MMKKSSLTKARYLFTGVSFAAISVVSFLELKSRGGNLHIAPLLAFLLLQLVAIALFIHLRQRGRAGTKTFEWISLGIGLLMLLLLLVPALVVPSWQPPLDLPSLFNQLWLEWWSYLFFSGAVCYLVIFFVQRATSRTPH